MKIRERKGLRYPDEFVTLMFYKENLDKHQGRLLELGCGSGNNLLHFSAYGWDVIGVDYDPSCVSDAKHNLMVEGLGGELIEHDLNNGLPELTPCLADGGITAFLVPSSLYYLNREAAWVCMREAREILAPNAIFYLRMRLGDDHRYGRGQPEGRNSYRLDCDHTGERGVLNVFWNEWEIDELLNQTMGIQPEKITRLKVSFENPQNGWIVRNSDLVLWGRVP